MQTLKNKKFFIHFSIFLVAGILLQLITRNAPTPENSKDLWIALPAFGVFVLFVMSLFSWGSFFRKKVSLPFSSLAEELMFDLGTGTVFMYVLAYALTPLHLFSSSANIFLWILLAVGFALGSCTFSMEKWSLSKIKGFDRVLYSIIPIIVILKLIEGIQFHQHGDAYVTYLPGPRAWAVSGNFDSFITYTQLFLSTSWEALFAWGTALMGFQGGAGLDVSQWFSQWVSGGLGVFGVLITVVAFSERLSKVFSLPSKWFSIIAVLTLQIPAFNWAQNLAKNDHGIAFWGMAAFYGSLYLSPLSAGLAFFTGVMAGAAAVGKFTLAILGVCIAVNIILRAKQYFIPFVVGGLVGSAPVFLRNFVLTKNPVFPWLPHVFPSEQLNEFASHGAAAATSVKFQWHSFPNYINEIYQQSPVVLAIVIMLFSFKYTKNTLKAIVLPVISFLIFTFTVRPSTGIRYQGPTLFLLIFFGAYFSFFLLNLVSEKLLNKRKDWVLGIVAIAVLATSNISFFTFFQIGKSSKFSPFPVVIQKTNEIGGPAKLWIRQNIAPNQSILSFGDVHIYYLIDYPLTEVGESIEYGKKIFGASLEEAERVFKTAPFDYLYLAGEDYYKDASFAKDQAQISDIMKRTNEWAQACKKFDNSKAQVWDLKCLRN